MDKEKLFAQIKGGLIVSCQALETEPLYTKEGGVMPLMAKAAAMSGAVGIRANTVRDITQIKQVVDLPVIGIIKKDYPGTPMYITVTMKEVDELVECGVDILAVQGTGALRPDGSTSAQFIRTIKAKYPDTCLEIPQAFGWRGSLWRRLVHRWRQHAKRALYLSLRGQGLGPVPLQRGGHCP